MVLIRFRVLIYNLIRYLMKYFIMQIIEMKLQSCAEKEKGKTILIRHFIWTKGKKERDFNRK